MSAETSEGPPVKPWVLRHPQNNKSRFYWVFCNMRHIRRSRRHVASPRVERWESDASRNSQVGEKGGVANRWLTASSRGVEEYPHPAVAPSGGGQRASRAIFSSGRSGKACGPGAGLLRSTPDKSFPTGRCRPAEAEFLWRTPQSQAWRRGKRPPIQGRGQRSRSSGPMARATANPVPLRHFHSPCIMQS